MQHCYIKLINIRKYKIIITTILLVIYAFIATPVQLWHHHNNETNSVAEKSSEESQATAFFDASLQFVDGNCQVCAHHHSIFIDTKVLSFTTPIIAFISPEQYYVFSIPSSPSLHFSNKGPPALI